MKYDHCFFDMPKCSIYFELFKIQSFVKIHLTFDQCPNIAFLAVLFCNREQSERCLLVSSLLPSLVELRLGGLEIYLAINCDFVICTAIFSWAYVQTLALALAKVCNMVTDVATELDSVVVCQVIVLHELMLPPFFF